MKKLTPILICLLVVFVGALFACNILGITDSRLYFNQFENQQAVSAQQVALPELSETDQLPAAFDLRDYNKINKTRDQGEQGSCWAFAANAALESRLLPGEQWDFSEDHMIRNNGFYDESAEGGDYFMAVAYLAAWKGPVPEDHDPYNDGATNPDAAVVKHLQNVVFLEDGDFETIKKMVYTYGAVESSIHVGIVDGQYIDETYYNRNQYSYCYDGTEEANHEIVIIGWDDAYSKDNFNTGAYQDGAFICLNSWGSEFGDNGIFYISYDDSYIGKIAEVYSGVEGSDNYNHIYQTDEHGWVGRMGFEEPTAFFANVYTAEGAEELKAVSFYATDVNTSYNVYVVPGYSSTENLLNARELCATGSMDYAGYYTVALDKTYALNAGERFAVIVEINTPGSKHPVAIEMDAGDGRTNSIVLEGHESYISSNGRSWDNTQSESGCNVCLKAFTGNR